MEQLTTLDAGFLQAEDSDPHISLAIGGLAILEGPAPDYKSLTATLSTRIGTCPRFAQKIRLRPLDLGPPEWVDDLNFDIAHHIRHIALPQPGDDGELFRFVGHEMAHRLDRDRPLWNIWVIEGLTGNRWAMLMKVHHCIGDGIATSHLLAGLCDNQIVTSFASHIRAAHEPASPGFGLPTGLTGPSLNPLRWLPELWTASTTMASVAARAARGAVEISAGLLRPSATTSLNGSMTTMRRFSAARVPLEDVQQICRAFDVTLNDVALAALTEGFRDMLLRRGETPQPESLRTLVPVSVRSTGALGVTDNRVSVMLPYLPVEEDNPVQRLLMVHDRLTRAKTTGQRQAGSMFVAATNHVPFPLTAWAVRLLTRLPQHGVTTLATNVPGPSEPLQILGHSVIAVLPIPPIALRLRSGVAMLSYADQLFFGILGDFDTVPDVVEFTQSIEAAVAGLVRSSKHPKAAATRRRLSLIATG